MPKKIAKTEVKAELLEANPSETADVETEEPVEESFFDKLTSLSNTSVALIAGIGLAFVIALVTMASGPGSVPVEALSQTSMLDVPETVSETMPAIMQPVASGGIERQGEGRHFFTTIKIPP